MHSIYLLFKMYFHSLTWGWCNRSQTNRCWASRYDWETSYSISIIRGDDQNTSASSLQCDINSKLTITTIIIVRANPVLWRGVWIKGITVKTTICIDWTDTGEWVCTTSKKWDLDCLVIIRIASVTMRPGILWTAWWQTARISR